MSRMRPNSEFRLRNVLGILFLGLVLTLCSSSAQTTNAVATPYELPNFTDFQIDDASVGIRIRQVAESYFYPSRHHSLVALYGYRVQEFGRICANDRFKNKKLDIGIAAIIRDGYESRNGVLNIPDNEIRNAINEQHELKKLCSDYLHEINGKFQNSRDLLIAVQKPIPYFRPKHRYLIDMKSVIVAVDDEDSRESN